MLRLPFRRWPLILYGLAVFFWLGPEDNHIWPVVLLGTTGALLAVYSWTAHRLQGQTVRDRQVVLLLAAMGSASGLGASVVTALLMLFKNARHAHIFPDYPAGMMGAILERAPLWALAGGLVGLGLGLLWLALHNDDVQPHQKEAP